MKPSGNRYGWGLAVAPDTFNRPPYDNGCYPEDRGQLFVEEVSAALLPAARMVELQDVTPRWVFRYWPGSVDRLGSKWTPNTRKPVFHELGSALELTQCLELASHASQRREPQGPNEP